MNARHPPVGVAEKSHECGDKQGADDGGVEDDPAGDRDREFLALVARARGQDEEGEQGDDRTRRAREQLGRLTLREREVAIEIGLGKSNAEIGRELDMRVATVKAHVSRLLEKLEFNNRVQIAILAHDAREA